MPLPAGERVSPFQWNAGWFGGQVGGTLWLLIGGVLLVAGPAPLIGLVWLGSFVIANLFGLALWLMRGRLRVYPAMQLFLVTLAILSLANIVLADQSGHLPELGYPRPFSPITAYGAWLVFPLISLVLYLTERFRSRPRGELADQVQSEPTS